MYICVLEGYDSCAMSLFVGVISLYKEG